MKINRIFISVLLLALIFPTAAKADLFDRGGGLIYDNDLNITWLQYANYADSTMTWDDAMTWSDTLVFQGFDDWRLPDSDISCSAYDCINSEMGHLYYTEGITSDSPGPFTNVESSMYWSGTEAETDPAKAWRFNLQSGYQGRSGKIYERYAWAVREGDSAPPIVPEPVSSILFMIGGATIAIRKKLCISKVHI